MADWLAGTWKLVAWRRITGDGTISYPLGTDARGQLIYTPDGRMGVQLSRSNRPPLATGDPLGGDAQAREREWDHAERRERRHRHPEPHGRLTRRDSDRDREREQEP